MPDIGHIDPRILNEAVVKTRRLPLLLVVGVALVGGFLATPAVQAAAAAAQAGPELTHLLRAMAGMKALAAAGLLAVTLWRLQSPARMPWLLGYMLAGAAMAAGPGLIWDMAHIKLGALLLHAGLLATVLLLWRDPATGARLETLILRRRLALRR